MYRILDIECGEYLWCTDDKVNRMTVRLCCAAYAVKSLGNPRVFQTRQKGYAENMLRRTLEALCMPECNRYEVVEVKD